MIQALRNALRLPDLRRRIFYTLLILVIFRAASHVPVPGIDRVALQQMLEGTSASIINFLDLLSGGAVARFSVLANGINPYINATIIFQLLVPVIPALQRISEEEGEAGRRKLSQWTYYITVPLAALQAWGQVQLFSSAAARPILPQFGFSQPEYILPTISVLATMTAGTMFAVWLGDLITEQGIGNGISLIIFGGIVSGAPSNIASIYTSDGWLGILFFVILTVLIVLVIVYVQEGQRRIPVQYGKRVRGRRMYSGGSTHIPLRVNTAGMIPLIFAQSILTFPAIIATFFARSGSQGVAEFAASVMNFFNPGSAAEWHTTLLYALLYFLAVVGFTYFYTFILVEQQDLAGTLQRQGGFIPGIRPGRWTEEYITKVYRRITLVGALFLGAVAVLPFVTQLLMETRVLLITASGLLIVVGVVVDTMRQLEAQLLMRHYEGFIKR